MRKVHISKSMFVIVRVLELIILWSTIFLVYSLLKDIVYSKTFPLVYLLWIFILFGILYTFLIIIEIIKGEFDINRIIALITFMIFCFSLFVGITIFNNNQPSVTFPQLPKGTIGLRTYECKVEFSEIEIAFLDSNNIWQKIPTEITNNKKNWKEAFNTYGHKGGNNNLSNGNDSLPIILDNSGIILDISKSAVSEYFNKAQYFKVSTKLIVDTSYVQYSDIQICMNVPFVTGKPDSEELYLGLSLPITDIDNAKIWIPALDWATGYSYRDPISKIEENGFGKRLQDHREYNLIGVSFLNSARILLKNNSDGAVSIICQSKRD